MHKRHSVIYWDSGENLDEAKHVVFLGVFNADRFRSKIENWLSNLEFCDSHFVIADNASIDDSLFWMTQLAKSLDSPVTILSNSYNYGGYGNLAINLRHFPNAEWITTLHQDDVYNTNHIQHHKKVMEKNIPNLGMICSEASSYLSDGRYMPYPRANWVLDDTADSVTIFLANLKNHTFPFSGATIARRVIEEYPIPWHSTAFPDTEIVMKMCIDFAVTFSPEITVQYLENPESESHSLLQEHRDFGAFQALVRVFSHPNYKRLCNLIRGDQQAHFISALREGISQRIKDDYLCLLMQQAALEITASHLPIGPEFARQLAKGYQHVGDEVAVGILNAIGSQNDHQITLSSHHAASEYTLDNSSSKQVSSVLTLANLLPYRWRRKLFQIFMKTELGKSMLRQWDFDWKGR